MLLEYRADKSMDELKKLTETKITVRRDGKKTLIDSQFLVPGDIIFLEEGIKVPVDARIFCEYGLEMNEASLTGESIPIKKNVEKVAQKTPLAERKCMIYAGTFVAKGSAVAIATITGQNTEFGTIEKTLGDVSKESTTLEKTVSELGKTITFAALAIVAIFFVIGIFFSKWKTEELLIYSISVIVAAVPEGMITFLTIILAIGVKNMASEKALVRKLKAVETLGNITFIATDKTGTITEGKMALVKIYDGKIKNVAELSGTEKILSYSYLCNSTHITENGVVGDETDRAFVIAGLAKGIDIQKFRQTTTCISFKPFDSVKKVMSGIYEINEEKIAITKGAPETILTMCSVCEDGEKIVGVRKDEIFSNLANLTNAGMRVIAIAYKKSKHKFVSEKGLIFLGFLALHDQIRKGVKEAIAIYKEAGIRVLIMTGDNLSTARKIAHEIGMETKDNIVNWSDLMHMNDLELDKVLKKITVVARATPASKLRIVERLVKCGEIIAVTGDGVNDALALKKAHIGIVMGSGTDVSKEVADIVLMDDNFATLEKAIEFGRGIATNIINFLRFQITTNFALVVLSIPFVIGIKIFEPVHIFWINLIVDGPPALTLGLEKPKKGIMKKKPMKRLSLIDIEFLTNVTHMALYMAFISAIIYIYYAKIHPEIATTATFTVFAFMQVFNALNCRSRYEHFYTSFFSNKWFILALSLVVLLQLAILYIQPLQVLFKTTDSLPFSDLILLFMVSATVLLVGEAKKSCKDFQREKDGLLETATR